MTLFNKAVSDDKQDALVEMSAWTKASQVNRQADQEAIFDI